MIAAKKIALGLLAAALLAMLGGLLPRLWPETARPSEPVCSTEAAVKSLSVSVPSLTLFPELNSTQITSLLVSTPERSFRFHMNPHGAVSVNGHRADHDIFSVLLDQIAALPVETHSAFAPRAQDLLMTLVVSTGAHQKTARFYAGSEGETARIVLGTDESPEYRQTNTWRVGTLMMTCEGTRILDAHGNEQPIIP